MTSVHGRSHDITRGWVRLTMGAEGGHYVMSSHNVGSARADVQRRWVRTCANEWEHGGVMSEDLGALELVSGRMSVRVDGQSGRTLSVVDLEDAGRMNWVGRQDWLTEGAFWGQAEGFETVAVRREDDGAVVVESRQARQQLRLTVRKSVRDGLYREDYGLWNEGELEFFVTPERFGLHYPFHSSLAPRPGLLSDSCVVHVWCGGAGSWLYAARPDGHASGLSGVLTEGSLTEYGIDFPVPGEGQPRHHDRGALTVHPEPCVLEPGGCLRLGFAWSFGEGRPDCELLSERGQRVRAWAERYTVRCGEEVRGGVEAAFDWSEGKVTVAGGAVETVRRGRRLEWRCVLAEAGERRVEMCLDGCRTWVEVQAVPPVEETLMRRARFIRERQQYRRAGSHLDGACLIYDRRTERQEFDQAFHDHNSARERLAMGCVLALALQHDPGDVSLRESLCAYRAYVERELLDLETMRVYDGACHDPFLRAYDYPWMADFLLECGKALGDVRALEQAAGVTLSYYRLVEGTGQDSPCLETLRLVRALEGAGLSGLAAEVTAALVRHADRTVARGKAMYSEEVSYTQEQFSMKVLALCQAWALTGRASYLEPVPGLLRCVRAFAGRQPDFHQYGQGVRYWDLYWFGGSRTYGDTMPQWLSSCTGRTLVLCGECLGDAELSAFGRRVVAGSLCLYDGTGFGSASYLVPWRVRMLPPREGRPGPHFPLGTFWGRRYDDWANDQDWSLYCCAVSGLCGGVEV